MPNNQDVITAGPRGPQLLQDVWFLEKLAHFDREVIPERRMHAKGSGAFGRFTVTGDITRFTKAKIFSEVGKTTELFARFSTVAGERGAADAERDIRGFAVKFYTEEGNWDLVGNNTPVFFFRDPLKFPDLNHAVKRDPRTNLRSATNNWDFWSSLPEADAATVPYHPFDLTKVWPKGDYPLIEVGEWQLDRNAENYFADVEQAAFNPGNVVPGISFSPDKMLQGRLFSYGDAQRYRLGVNHFQIPVNAPRCPVDNFHRDGTMRVDGNQGGTLHYEPNSYGKWQEQPEYRDPPESVGDVAGRWDARADDDDYYSQPRRLFELMNAAQRQALFENMARNIAGVPDEIVARHVENCTRCHPDYGAGVTAAIAALG